MNIFYQYKNDKIYSYMFGISFYDSRTLDQFDYQCLNVPAKSIMELPNDY